MNWDSDNKNQDFLDSREIRRLATLAKQSMTIPGMTKKKAILHELKVTHTELYNKIKKGECIQEFHQMINTLKL